MNKTFSGKRIILVCILTRPLQDYYRRSEHNADGISSKFIKTISAFVVLIARSMQSLAQPKQRLKQVGGFFSYSGIRVDPSLSPSDGHVDSSAIP